MTHKEHLRVVVSIFNFDGENVKTLMRSSVAGFATLALLLGGGIPTANAVDPDSPAVANDVSGLISSVSENDDPLIEPTATASSFVATSTDGTVEVSLPIDGKEIYIADRAGGATVGIGMPLEASVESPELAHDGTLVYPSDGEEKGVDVAVETIEDGSVRVQTVLSSLEAPHEFTYPLTLPAGTTLSLQEDGSVTGIDPEGNFVVGAQAPWAKDVNGNDVTTSYRVEGDSIIQTVAPVDAGSYPVVADPWFGTAIISKAVWANGLWKYSPTLKVYPTSFGRKVTPIARWAAWSETLTKTPRKGWPNPNTASMRDQFYCHFDLVRIRAPKKEYWGLDSKLPSRGYWGFIGNSCN